MTTKPDNNGLLVCDNDDCDKILPIICHFSVTGVGGICPTCGQAQHLSTKLLIIKYLALQEKVESLRTRLMDAESDLATRNTPCQF